MLHITHNLASRLNVLGEIFYTFTHICNCTLAIANTVGINVHILRMSRSCIHNTQQCQALSQSVLHSSILEFSPLLITVILEKYTVLNIHFKIIHPKRYRLFW